MPDHDSVTVEHRGARAWPARRQWGVLGVAAVAIAAVLGIVARAGGTTAASPASSETIRATPGRFVPSPAQLATLVIEPVSVRRFAGTVVTDGRLAPDGDAITAVYAPLAGRVARVLAGPGETVSSGASLAVLDGGDYAQAIGELRSAAAQRVLAVATAERARSLLDGRGASVQDVEKAQADRVAADAALAAARGKLRALGFSDEQIASAAEGKTEATAVALRAPIAGVVVDRQLGVGQFVQAGAGPVFSVADLRRLWVMANVREADAARVMPGQPVDVTVPAWPGRVFHGRVDRVSPTVDPVTHRVVVRARLDNADGALKPDMLATVSIQYDAGTEGVAVPESAIVHDGEKSLVWVARGSELVLRPVKTARESDGAVQVVAGLAAGERIVTRGSLFVTAAAESS